jgi:hypothetical protein
VGKVWAQIVADNTASGTANPNAPASANIPSGNLNVVDAGTWVFVTGPATRSIPPNTPEGQTLAKNTTIEAGQGVVVGKYYLTLNSNGDLALYSVNSQNPKEYNTTPVWSYSSQSLVPPGETASSVTWDGFAFDFTTKGSSVSNGVPLTSMPNSDTYITENKNSSLTFKHS